MLIDLDQEPVKSLTCPDGTYKITRFPDSQPHIKLNIKRGFSAVSIRCAITSPEKLLLLLQTVNAIKRNGHTLGGLMVPYLMGARYDRLMADGDSLDLEVIADLINSCDFREVKLFDVHSDVSLALIHRSNNVDNGTLVSAYVQEDAVLIVPDAGAAKKAERYLKWRPNITSVSHCSKSRDLNTGHIKLTVLDPGSLAGRNCVIIDDICDGGATFLSIAEQIKPAHLTLIVSHGIFSKGLERFKSTFHEIITSNSFPSEVVKQGNQLYDQLAVTVVKHPC